MKLYIDRKVSISFIIAILLSLSVGIVSYLSIYNLVTSSRLVTHTHNVLEEINKISFLLDETELISLKHSISKNKEYIGSYTKVENIIKTNIDKISEMTFDNPAQQKNILELSMKISTKMSILKSILESNESIELSLATRYINSENNEKLKEQISFIINKMILEENNLLLKREEETDRNTRITIYIIISGTIISLIIAIISIYMINQDIIRRKIAEKKLKDNEANLEQKIEERTVELSHSNNYLKDEISERKKIEQDLKKANKELNNFAYIASHDLQEPLRTISSYTQLLKKRMNNKLNEDETEFMGLIIDGATRMKQLIEDLLEYSKVGTKSEKNYKEINLNNVIETVKENLKISIKENKAEIISEDLPVIFADEFQMIQLFQNIIGNSIKYHGEEPPVIKVSYEKTDNENLFIISDNGIGIDPQYFERIFEIFRRLHSKSEYSGTGIGLATCKKIVDQYNGRIWVESEEGKGAKFLFTLKV